jgi:hypothetical protein
VNDFYLGYSNNYYSINSCYQSQSFYKSQSFYTPISSNLNSMSFFQYQPTQMPTLLPLDTYSPTQIPTTNKPTLSPTLSPTQIPTTNKPTLSSTLLPSNTLKPISTRMPTKYNAPTYMPTQIILPLLTFETVGRLTGLTSPILLNSDKEAIIIATAASMNINYSFVSLTNYSVVSRRRLFVLLSSYNIQYTTSINYPLTNNNVSLIQNTYNSFINLLVASVANGVFNNYLQLAAIALNATAVSSSTITNISVTSYSVITLTNSPTLSPTTSKKDNYIQEFNINKDLFDFILLLMLFGLPICIYLLIPFFKKYYLRYKIYNVSPYPISSNNNNNNNNNNKEKSNSLVQHNNIMSRVEPVENVLLLDDEIFDEIKRKTDDGEESK